MSVDKGLIDWFLDKVETHGSQKTEALRKYFKKPGVDPAAYAEEALRDKPLQQVADELLIDNPPDRTQQTPGASG